MAGQTLVQLRVTFAPDPGQVQTQRPIAPNEFLLTSSLNPTAVYDFGSEVQAWSFAAADSAGSYIKALGTTMDEYQYQSEEVTDAMERDATGVGILYGQVCTAIDNEEDPVELEELKKKRRRLLNHLQCTTD